MKWDQKLEWVHSSLEIALKYMFLMHLDYLDILNQVMKPLMPCNVMTEIHPFQTRNSWMKVNLRTCHPTRMTVTLYSQEVSVILHSIG